ncbi:MAG: hypothetical protein ABI634_05775 [Acidobacteriota bacterium]
MSVTASPTELTTALTDAALAVVCLVLLARLLKLPLREPFKVRVWAWVFGFLSLASALGALTHGFEWTPFWKSVLWAPLYLCLGVVVALFIVGAVSDWKGVATGRALLPWAIGVALMFFVVTRLTDRFIVFVAYEGVVMLASLAIYITLWLGQRKTWAGVVAVGITLNIIAAAVQASPLRLVLVVPFDHNGLFHLVEIVAVIVTARGLREGLSTAS